MAIWRLNGQDHNKGANGRDEMLLRLRKNLFFLLGTLGNYRFSLPLIHRFSHRYPNLTDERTDICIEGYPRSGNTYFVATFLRWNPTVKVGHHSHLAASAKAAVKRRIPTVIIIREPEDAASSVVVWDDCLAVGMALWAYISFYSSLWRYRHHMLVLDFEDVVKQPDECVLRINKRFDCSFSSVEFTAEEDDKTRQALDRNDRRVGRDDRAASLPNRLKQKRKSDLHSQFLRSWFYTRARRWWERYVEMAGPPNH